MVALGAGGAALAFLSPDELLEFPMQLLDLPAHGVLVLNDVRGEPSVSITLRLLVVWFQVTVGDDPLNVAVWGDQLEEAHEKRQLFELDACAMPKTGLIPIQRVQMHIAFVLGLFVFVLLFARCVLSFAGADQTVAFERGYEHHPEAVNDFQIVHRSVPGVKKNGVGLELFVAFSPQQHF